MGLWLGLGLRLGLGSANPNPNEVEHVHDEPRHEGPTQHPLVHARPPLPQRLRGGTWLGLG
eukprot:scaffold3802_cov67-Phaeocystis_antarctica.AAC.3